MSLTKRERRIRIKRRIRKRVYGENAVPRLTVYRSNKHIYAQIIDDTKGVTLVSASSKEKQVSEVASLKKIDQASKVGKVLAERALGVNISAVVFDRNGYLYHGRVKSLADAVRKEGLKF